MSKYPWSTLTSAIDDKNSPLRIYLDRRFPDRKAARTSYGDCAGPFIVESGGANAGTIGTAFDLAVRLSLTPEHLPAIAVEAPALESSERDALLVVLESAGRSESAGDTRGLAQACWPPALGVELLRNSYLPGSPLLQLRASGGVTAERLTAAVPAAAIEELVSLLDLAGDRLLPRLSAPVHLGPTFDGSRYCRADADLIAAGTLVELKVKLGPKNARTGTRRDVLPLPDLLQVISYALFDTSDEYSITDVSVYSARYGTWWSRPLDELLVELAGGPVDLPAERAEVHRLLTTG